MKRTRAAIAAILLIGTLGLAACARQGSGTAGKPGAAGTGTAAQGSAPAGEPRTGGVLRVALNSEPPTLDYQYTTAGLTKKVAWHIYETLFTLGKNYEVVSMLAEKADVSSDGKTYTITLRRDVPFHNGKIMTAEDVVASLERWAQLAPSGRALFANVESLTAPDPHTVVFRLKEPYSSLLPALASTDQAPAIMPREIAEAAGKDPVKEIVGTGPYRLAEWKKDQYIRLVRFDRYAARPEPAEGLGGKKVAYLDEIRFLPVKDPTVRADGVQTGEYDVADIIPADQYERLKDNPELQVVIEKPFRWVVGVFNTVKPPFNDVRVRQAALAAVNPAEVMAAAIGPQEFWRLDPGLQFQEQVYHSTAGAEYYNQNSPEKARRLLQEAGYAGQPVILLTTKDYDYMYKAALVTKSHLEAAGFKVDLQVYDWPSLVERRARKDAWDMFFTGILFSADPSQIPFIGARGAWPGWWTSERVQHLMKEFNAATDTAQRKAVFDRIQQAFYEEAPMIKYGDAFEQVVLSRKVQGYVNRFDIAFWNVWKTE
ncbi:ABC transporter substrate-binding protein [Caldinitratiruptor microaerophilus]|uniref:Peptide ABC transporter substrate-binding protein n=1 Tax=Caldinitratiruptor microaerophilus TaxID=671077 RepID=A0AA35CJD2_9FIRM|nr:ABC transporter substrate-binding protein [Caldinitratiruptor microaerophilus]BDG59529.1 peptide ABC transporter substrate-binding protein [Caldinitratiruptor microaerophilus]